MNDKFSDDGFNGLDTFKIMAGGKFVSMVSSESLVAGLFTVTRLIC